jgi:hypothetical protein
VLWEVFHEVEALPPGRHASGYIDVLISMIGVPALSVGFVRRLRYLQTAKPSFYAMKISLFGLSNTK